MLLVWQSFVLICVVFFFSLLFFLSCCSFLYSELLGLKLLLSLESLKNMFMAPCGALEPIGDFVIDGMIYWLSPVLFAYA